VNKSPVAILSTVETFSTHDFVVEMYELLLSSGGARAALTFRVSSEAGPWQRMKGALRLVDDDAPSRHFGVVERPARGLDDVQPLERIQSLNDVHDDAQVALTALRRLS